MFNNGFALEVLVLRHMLMLTLNGEFEQLCETVEKRPVGLSSIEGVCRQLLVFVENGAFLQKLNSRRG